MYISACSHHWRRPEHANEEAYTERRDGVDLAVEDGKELGPCRGGLVKDDELQDLAAQHKHAISQDHIEDRVKDGVGLMEPGLRLQLGAVTVQLRLTLAERSSYVMPMVMSTSKARKLPICKSVYVVSQPQVGLPWEL